MVYKQVIYGKPVIAGLHGPWLIRHKLALVQSMANI